MILWVEWEKSFPFLVISGVSVCHIEFPHAGAHVDILVALVAVLAYRGVGESLLGELSQGRPGQDVARAPSKVATKVFEMMSEVDGFVCIETVELILSNLSFPTDATTLVCRASIELCNVPL